MTAITVIRKFIKLQDVDMTGVVDGQAVVYDGASGLFLPKTAAGPAGPAGATGATGPAGPGVPTGGAIGTVLTKSGVADYATIWQAPTAGGGLPADSIVPSGTRIIANKLLAGDAQPNWRLDGSGKIEWGGGGSASVDTALYRPGPSWLKTDGDFTANGAVECYGGFYVGAAVGDTALGIYVKIPVLDSNNRFEVLNSGKLQWSAGATAVDTNLYRYAAGILKTDGQIRTGSLVTVMEGAAGQLVFGSGGVASIYFGSAGDANLYRLSANALKTDGQFYVLNLFTSSYARINSGIANSEVVIGYNGSATAPAIIFGPGGTWDTKLYRFAAGVLKTDGDLVIVGKVTGNGTVPAGGSTGQVLAKNSGTDYDIQWVAAGSGSGSAGYYNNAATHGAGTTITITQATHGLRSSRGIQVQVQDNTTGAVEYPDIVIASNGNVTITYGASVSANTKMVTLVG